MFLSAQMGSAACGLCREYDCWGAKKRVWERVVGAYGGREDDCFFLLRGSLLWGKS